MGGLRIKDVLVFGFDVRDGLIWFFDWWLESERRRLCFFQLRVRRCRRLMRYVITMMYCSFYVQYVSSYRSFHVQNSFIR